MSGFLGFEVAMRARLELRVSSDIVSVAKANGRCNGGYGAFGRQDPTVCKLPRFRPSTYAVILSCPPFKQTEGSQIENPHRQHSWNWSRQGRSSFPDAPSSWNGDAASIALFHGCERIARAAPAFGVLNNNPAFDEHQQRCIHTSVWNSDDKALKPICELVLHRTRIHAPTFCLAISATCIHRNSLACKIGTK
jgi:hypothetical protein